MFRAIFASACVALALALIAGCGGTSSDGGGGPRLDNPNDPKVKDLKPKTPGGGGAPNTPAPQ
jgi:hypothetical protein